MSRVPASRRPARDEAAIIIVSPIRPSRVTHARASRTMGDIGKTIAEKKDQFDAWLKAQSDAVRATRERRDV